MKRGKSLPSSWWDVGIEFAHANLGLRDLSTKLLRPTHAATRHRPPTSWVQQAASVQPCPWLRAVFHPSSALSVSCGRCSLTFSDPSLEFHTSYEPTKMEQEVSILLLGDADVGKTTFLSYVHCAFSSHPLRSHSDLSRT